MKKNEFPQRTGCTKRLARSVERKNVTTWSSASEVGGAEQRLAPNQRTLERLRISTVRGARDQDKVKK